LRKSLSIANRFWILVLVPLVFELIVLGSLLALERHTSQLAQRAQQSMQVLAEIHGINEDVYRLGIFAFQRNFRRDESMRNFSEFIQASLEKHATTLKSLTTDNEEERRALDRVSAILQRSRQYLAEQRAPGESNSPLAKYLRQDDRIQAFRTLNDELATVAKEEEQRAAAYSAQWSKARESYLLATAAAVTLGILVSAVLAFQFKNAILSRLNTIMSNISRFAHRERLEPPVSGTDEIAKLDGAFHDLTHALEEAALFKQQFFAMVAHDLRSPLTSQRFFLFSIASKTLSDPDALAKQAQVLSSDLDRLLNLINNLLDIEKMEAGKLELKPSPICPVEVFEKALNSVVGLLQVSQIKLLRDFETAIDNPEKLVMADSDKLIQVLVNLLSNAAKFAPPGSEIKVALHEVGDFWEFRVIDQGPGIPAEHRELIFQRFEQIATKNERARAGSGLGLAISKSLVTACGGDISVDSTPGPGSTFSVRMPIVIDEDTCP
jgi:signal transduction histidine kinase